MSNQSEKPRLSVSLGKEVSIYQIASSLELDPQLVRNELEAAIREHYYHFASKPITLEFEPKTGYTLKASSSVGVLSTPSFLVDIMPKIPDLSIGKALGLAQESGINLLNINEKSLARNGLSDQSSYSSVEFLAFSLADSALTVRHNGFARKFDEVMLPASKLSGSIAFQETVSSGSSLLSPYVNNVEPSIDIYPNQVIKAALALCLASTSSSDIKSLLRVLLDSMNEVQTVPIEKLNVDELFINFTVPRPDYDMALAFSKAILEGRLISESDSTIFTPSFTLDLDKVFESYCTTQVQKLIVPNRFEVLAQAQFPHDMVPDISEKKIIPDVLIRDKQNGKIIILDLKNKYSQLRDEGGFKISNDDLYQLTYYAKTLGAKCCFVVYPGANPRIQYPLKGSEGQPEYERKRIVKLEEINTKSKVQIFKNDSVTLYTYSVNLLGSLQDTKKSVASLCQLMIDVL